MTETTEIATAGALPAAANPMAMIAEAVTKGASIDVLERLMGLQERFEANQAKKAFTEAFAAFKSEATVIVRNREVTDGPLKGKKFAELFSFVDAVTPALSKHNLTASWDITKDEKDWIEVTCIIEHVMGGKKTVSFGGPPDTGGAKNPIQARASTVTYLERYTLKAACGLAEQGDDKDGNAEAETVNMEQIEELNALIEKAVKLTPETTREAWEKSFLDFIKFESIEAIPAKYFTKAKTAIESAIRGKGGKP